MLAKIALAALAATAALAAPAAAAPDAELFATNNTSVITDPADPRLDVRLERFAQRVERIIERGGGTPRGSRLLDGVFFSEDIGFTTFERSRSFDVDRVDTDELREIAEDVGARFRQRSVLTFDHLPRHDAGVDAIRLEVPGVTAAALQDGLLSDQEARERLFGGSVTQDERLILVAGLADESLARSFAADIGGDLARARTAHGDSEFVEPPAAPPFELRGRTLLVTAEGRIGLETGRTIRVDLAADGTTDFAVRRGAVDRVRFVARGAQDAVVLTGDHDRLDLRAERGRAVADVGAGPPVILGGVETLEASGDRLTTGDLAFTDLQELHGTFRTATLAGTAGADNVSISSFGSPASIIGLPVFMQLAGVEALRVNAGDGEDDLSAGFLAPGVQLTLDGGDGGGTLRGGPGDDRLIGGDGFDDAVGGRGDDVATLDGYFDRFSWAPGDGSDRVDGGASRDSLFFLGTTDDERFALARRGSGVRMTRDVGGIVMDLDAIEEIDTLAHGGADTFAVADLTGTPVALVDVSLSPGFGSPGGDGRADRVTVAASGAVRVAGSRGTARVTGLSADVNITHAEVALDVLAISGAAAVDSSGLAPDTIGLEVD